LVSKLLRYQVKDKKVVVYPPKKIEHLDA